MDKILKEAYEHAKKFTDEGVLPTYQPQLAKANKDNLGAVIIDDKGDVHEIGNTDVKFTAQSIIKVLLYQIALENYDLEEIKSYVGLKGSSKPFNSIADLELSDGKRPVNPFINSGALVITYLLCKEFKDKAFDIVLEKAKEVFKNDTLDYDKVFVETGKPVAFRNLAIINTLKSNGTIEDDVSTDEILDLYFKACCILVDAKDLANYSFILSNGGKSAKNESQIVDEKHARILRTLMAVAGMYDYSGDFAVEIGIPAKSGVGGGILGATNKGFGISSYSPGLDPQGNSLAGIKFLEYVSEKLNISIY